jgi:hypothetical protein
MSKEEYPYKRLWRWKRQFRHKCYGECQMNDP